MKFMKHLHSSFFTMLIMLLVIGCKQNEKVKHSNYDGPIIISTWDAGMRVNDSCWQVLDNSGSILDAIEKGGNWIESKQDCCVGLGGNPDRDGIVTLDASIMNHDGGIGSVAAIERIRHPISVARKVMENTPHVLLVGEGAQQFALEQGFSLEPQELSKSASVEYHKWLKSSKYEPKINVENISAPNRLSNGDFNHDTMAMIGKDDDDNMGGGVTTSGMGFKMRGRVGDSPIIGAGLYVDNEVGAATSSGMGEEVIRIVGSHLVVELMRQGKSPKAACKEAVMRIINKRPDKAKDLQVGFIALDKSGNYGAYAIQSGFTYAVKSNQESKLYKSESFYTSK
jgi:N4-(beta-N-acetylglucosaminyl)-L-asparaginase